MPLLDSRPGPLDHLFRPGNAVSVTLVNAVTGGLQTVISYSRAIDMVVGDYVEVITRHTAGAALDVSLADFTAIRVSR